MQQLKLSFTNVVRFLFVTLHLIVMTVPNINAQQENLKLEHKEQPLSAYAASLRGGTAANNNSVETSDPKSCHILSPKAIPLPPTMIASYPGSGAKLTWKLIRAITGYMTSDDAVDLNDLSKNGLVIAIKTHYPARGSNEQFFAPFQNVPRSVLLIRNPLNAIPSFHSFIYEQSKHLTGHSVRAPVETWITWRDVHFDNEMELWMTHTRYWMTRHSYENRLILPYEFLIKPGSGYTELRRLRTFLNNGGEIDMRMSMDKVDCIWDYIVMRREDQGSKSGSMRQGGPSVWPYTYEQFQKMKAALVTLQKEFPEQLAPLFDLYLYDIDEAQQKLKVEQSELESGQ